MKRLFRINYIILMIAAFFIIYQQAFIQRYNKFYKEKGKVVLASDTQYKDLFLYEAKGIHQEEPLFTIENSKITIKFYEVSLLDFDKTDNVVTNLFPVVKFAEDIERSDDLIYALNFKRNMPGDDSVYPFEIFNYLDLDVYLVDSGFHEMLPIMTEDEDYDLINKNITGLEVFSVNDNEEIEQQFLTSRFSFDENSFPIRNELVSRLKEKELNEEPLEFSKEEKEELYNNNGIIFQQLHNASKYNYILFLWFGGYFTFLIITGYFVFYYQSKEKRLGRKKPTSALKESIKQSEKEKEQESKKEDLE